MSDAVEMDPKVIQVKRLHKKTSKDDLRALAEQFGAITNISLWYGFGTGLIEMQDAQAASAIFNAFRDTPAHVRGKPVVLKAGVAARQDQIYNVSSANPDYVEKEIARCVYDLCKLVEAKDVRRAANDLRAKHNALIRQYTRNLEESGRQRKDVCWDWVSTGRCPHGDECIYKHEVVPLCDLPAKYRWFLRKDTFPRQREAGQHKKAVNEVLKLLIDSVPNVCGVILDGASCNSVRSFAGGTHNRGPHNMYCPNVCTETYIAIRDSHTCQAYHGSARSFLDSCPGAVFGFLYLDYCCSLTVGKNRVEKSPIGDLETIFRLGQCDTRGCILCVSLAVRSARTPRWKTALSSGKTTLSKDDDLEEEEEEDEEEDEEEEEENTAVSGAGCSCAPAEGEKESSDVFEDDAQRVRCLVSNLAVAHGLAVLNYPRTFRWPGNFAEIFFLASPDDARAYLAKPGGCPFSFRLPYFGERRGND